MVDFEHLYQFTQENKLFEYGVKRYNKKMFHKRKSKRTKKLFIPKHDDICVMGGIVQCKYVASQIITPYKTEHLYTLSKDKKLNIDCDFRRSIKLANASTKKFILDGIEAYQKWHTNEQF